MPLAKNWTLAIVPSESVAVAVKVLAEPTPTVLAAGAVIATAGDALAATVTEMAALVAWLPLLSVVSVVSEYVPLAVGVHVLLPVTATRC